MRSPLKIKIGVSPTRNNNGDDILQLKQALESLDYYKTPKYGITPYPDKDIFSSILKFQKDMGLKTDAIVNPGGETEKTINERFKVSSRAPQMRCRICTDWHAGTYGDVCRNCYLKGLGGSAPERV